MVAERITPQYTIPLLAKRCEPGYCIAESLCRLFTVKFTYEPDELPFEDCQVVGYACPKTSLVTINRKYRRQEDVVLDKLKLIPEKKTWLEMP